MNYVEQIHDKLLEICQDKMGVNAQRLRKVFDPEQNDFRNIELGYGVRHSAATSDTDATKVFILSHQFDILLADRAANRDHDSAIQDRLNNLYSKADEIFKEAVKNKLGLVFVTFVHSFQFGEPQVLTNGSVLLTASFDVNYYLDPY